MESKFCNYHSTEHPLNEFAFNLTRGKYVGSCKAAKNEKARNSYHEKTVKICSLEDCNNLRARGSGLCNSHYYDSLRPKYCYWSNCENLACGRGRTCTRHNNLHTRHRITENKWNSIWEYQKGLCRMCNESLIDDLRVSVDHNRNCCDKDTSCGNCIRGLVHQQCNVIEGYVKALQEKLGVVPLFYTNVQSYQSLPSYVFNDEGDVVT